VPGGPGRLPARGSHRSVRARIRAYGSSSNPWLCRDLANVVTNPYMAVRWRCRDTRQEFNASHVEPSNRRVTRCLASLHRVLAGRVPRLLRYYQDTATSCRPSRRTSLPSLGGTTGALGRFRLSRRRRVPSDGPGVVHPVSPTGIASVETTGSPKFLGSPHTRLLMLSDPGRPKRP